MTDRPFDPLRPVVIVFTVCVAAGLILLIGVLSSRKVLRRRRGRGLTTFSRVVGKAWQRSLKPGEYTHAT